MSFLTVEDVNGAVFREGSKSFYYEVDTSDIPADGDFSEVVYDFVKVSRTESSGSYTFTFEVYNSLWKGPFYVRDLNGNYINYVSFTSPNIITASTNEKNVILTLYCTELGEWESKGIAYVPLESVDKYIYLNQVGDEFTLRIREVVHHTEWEIPNTYELGIYSWKLSSYTHGYGICRLIKTDFQFNCNQDLTFGKVNRVLLGTDSKYKPNGSMIGTYTPSISVVYGNQVIPVEWDEDLNDYAFDIDLTNIRYVPNVKFNVVIESNKAINHSETKVILKNDYKNVSTFNELKTACATGGDSIIQIGADIQFTSSITVEHNLKIMGNDATLDLNEYGFVLDEKVSFTAENLQFDNGDTAIIQAENTVVTLQGCTFTNCTSTNYDQLGSCIFCDIDIDNLEITNDFETNLYDCTFIDNQSCILHGGQLTVDNCKLHNTDPDYIDTHNVAFIYQTDGNANITNSIFDIDYDTDEFCSNEINLGFAQALVMCGETALINGATHIDLGKNNSLPFYTHLINNQTHLFAKYYYPQIESCVYASPIPTKENQSCCHAVSGVDWIFKNNVQITRTNSETENRNNPIQWEEE